MFNERGDAPTRYDANLAQLLRHVRGPGVPFQDCIQLTANVDGDLNPVLGEKTHELSSVRETLAVVRAYRDRRPALMLGSRGHLPRVLFRTQIDDVGPQLQQDRLERMYAVPVCVRRGQEEAPAADGRADARCTNGFELQRGHVLCHREKFGRQEGHDAAVIPPKIQSAEK